MKRPSKQRRSLPPRKKPLPLDKEALAVKPESIMVEARHILGKRYREYGGSLWLDNKPASVGEIILAANTLLARSGTKQLGKNEAWHAQKVVARPEETC